MAEARARLAVVLRRLAIGNAEVTPEGVRSHYRQRARELHPDMSGHGAESFVQLKKDTDEALELLERLRSLPGKTFHSAGSSSFSHSFRAAPASRGADEPPAVERPGLPPMVLVAALAVGTLLLRLLTTSTTVPPSKSAPATQQAAAQPPAKSSESMVVKRSSSDYYKSRVTISKESKILAQRPHAKQRGGLYVPPVHSASEDGLAEWLHWVGERSSASLTTALDRNQQTPLHYAARAGQYDTCAVLLKFHADPLARDKKRITPLDLARESGHLQVVKLLETGPPGPFAGQQFRQRPTLHSQNQGIVG